MYFDSGFKSYLTKLTFVLVLGRVYEIIVPHFTTQGTSMHKKEVEFQSNRSFVFLIKIILLSIQVVWFLISM